MNGWTFDSPAQESGLVVDLRRELAHRDVPESAIRGMIEMVRAFSGKAPGADPKPSLNCGESAILIGWPFRRVSLRAYLELSEADRAYVEDVLTGAIEGLGGRAD